MLKVFTGNETANTFSSAVEGLLLNTPNANTACVGGCVIVPLDIIDVDTIVKVVDGCELDKRDYKCPGIDDCGRFDWFYYCTVVHSECDPNMFRC